LTGQPRNDVNAYLKEIGSLPEDTAIANNDGLTRSGHIVLTKEPTDDFRTDTHWTAHGNGNRRQNFL
jgi:hypothetical protein